MRVRTAAIILLFTTVTAVLAAAPPKTSCTTCHDSELFDAAARDKVAKFPADVHAQVGLSCHDCHGGNPDLTLADDISASMDSGWKPNPYRGVPERTEIPDFCGRCHSSAQVMKRFNPAARVDQVTEYWTSRHGQRLRAGDVNVATCVDCHSVHDIRRRTEPQSPVHPTRVAETCSRCHSDAKLMASYTTAAGQPLPTDQYARWKVSVHATAMLQKGDLTAPTCNDCHGNHGATPPGVESVSFVCGQCHAREAELFRASRKHQLWTEHAEMTSGAECGSCHEGNRAKLKLTHFTECVTCHENHAVVRPTVAMIGILPETPCAFCHEGVGPLAKRVAEPLAKAEHYTRTRDGLLVQAKALRLEGDARFDWLVDRTLALPTHLAPARENGTPSLRPEFASLFEKFRIGRTHYTYVDAAGKSVSVPVRRCNDCHDDAGRNGAVQARSYLAVTRALTSMIARSERILLAAHRGGVEVRKIRPDLDAAIDTQIELETLVHTFAAPAVEAKQKEGLEHAKAALLAGQQSLEELQYRRQGLLIALGVILLVLIALTLKIRTL